MSETPEQRFDTLAEALLSQPDVTYGGGQGFGSSGLKSSGRIFAMLVRGQLVVKLPRQRVAALIAAGEGTAFDANRGRPMREWLVLANGSSLEWLALAREAEAFVAARK